MYYGKIKPDIFHGFLYAMDFRTSGPSWTNPVTSGSGNNSEFGRNAFGTFVGPLSLIILSVSFTLIRAGVAVQVPLV